MKREKEFLEGLRTEEGPGQKLSPLFLGLFFQRQSVDTMRSCKLDRPGNRLVEHQSLGYRAEQERPRGLQSPLPVFFLILTMGVQV